MSVGDVLRMDADEGEAVLSGLFEEPRDLCPAVPLGIPDLDARSQPHIAIEDVGTAASARFVEIGRGLDLDVASAPRTVGWQDIAADENEVAAVRGGLPIDGRPARCHAEAAAVHLLQRA